MLKQDILRLTPGEQRAIADAFHVGYSPRRVRGVLFSGAVLLVGVAAVLTLGFGKFVLAAFAMVTVCIAAAEKLVYQRTMERQESTLRKLVHRVEELEGVPLSPDIETSEPQSIQVTERGHTSKIREQSAPPRSTN